MSRYLKTSMLVFIALYISAADASRRPCKLTRDFRKSTISGNEELHVVGNQFPLTVDCSSRNIVHIPTYIGSDVAELFLNGNGITKVRSNDFANVPNLRALVLSHNSIRTLESRCFRHLGKLERLDLNDNDLTSISADAFVGLQSLRVLTMSALPLTSYPTQFATHTPLLRVLSLSAIGGATIPAEYARLPRLEVLDFYKDSVPVTQLTAAMFDNIRDSDIKTLSFRSLKHLREIEVGAFSNLSNTRSLIIAFNKQLSFRKTVAALAASTNTTVDSVVLDGASGDKMTILVESDFCSPFWRAVRRLSIRGTSLLGFVFAKSHCLSQLRELVADYNSPIMVQPISPDFPAIFANLKTLSLSHRTLGTRAYYHAYDLSREDLFNVGDYFPTRPPVMPVANIETTNTCNYNNLLSLPSSLEFLYMTDIRSKLSVPQNGTFCVGNVRYLNLSHNSIATVLRDGCRINSSNRLEIIDLSHGQLETIPSEFFYFPRLRYLNLSNNALGVSGSDFRETFRHLIRLEDINLSGNKLARISPEAFKRCTRLRRLNLANNELINIDLNFRHMVSLEYIDLSDNYLMRLSNTFMAKLDQQFNVRSLDVNIHSHMLICNHNSASFVCWTRVTHVRLTDRNHLTCSYNGRRDTKMVDIPLDQIKKKCSFPVKAVVVPIGVGLLISFVVFALLRYQRWYVLNRLMPNQLPGSKASIYIQAKQPKAALLYLRSIESRNKQRGSTRLLRWDDDKVAPLGDEKLSLNIRRGDSDV